MSWCVFQNFQKTVLKTLEQSNASWKIVWIKRLIAKTWDTLWHNSECIGNKLRIKKATLEIAIGNESRNCMLHATLHFQRDRQCFSAFIPAARHQKVLPGDRGRGLRKMTFLLDLTPHINELHTYICPLHVASSYQIHIERLNWGFDKSDNIVLLLNTYWIHIEYKFCGRFSVYPVGNRPMAILDMGLGLGPATT